MQQIGKRKLASGREVTVHRNGGLRKVCGCPRPRGEVPALVLPQP